jgi:hypothetical protein
MQYFRNLLLMAMPFRLWQPKFQNQMYTKHARKANAIMQGHLSLAIISF